MKIDSHHHFWHYTAKEFGWIKDNMSVIRRDFLASDLSAAIHSAGVDGAVSVQARTSLDETRFLLDIAGKESIIKGVVGWVDFTNPKVDADIEQFTPHKKLKGFREVLQEEPANALMDSPQFNAGISKLLKHKLVYDVLIYERHLKQAAAFVDKHPNQVFVLDHIAKPRIADGLMEPWRTLMKEIAKREHLYCKLSGMVTEADHQHWTPGKLRPYIDTVLEAFGPKRVMFGSDWPVMLVAAKSYKQWVDVVGASIANLSKDEQARIWAGTATEAYKL